MAIRLRVWFKFQFLLPDYSLEAFHAKINRLCDPSRRCVETSYQNTSLISANKFVSPLVIGMSSMKTLLVFLSFLAICSCSSKKWLLDVNFDNPKNWDSGNTPCATNKIIFPDTVTIVLLQTNLSSVKEMILPMNGEILFPSDLTLPFSDDADADPNCDGQDINFIRTESESWFQPANWLDTDNLVTVETERVPCHYDRVIYPEDKVFSVALDTSVTVGQMSFSGQDYTTDQFNAFLASESGMSQFDTNGSAAVTIQGSQCPKTSGCPCGNDSPELFNKICDQYTCLNYACKGPVTPVGGCCVLCGAILTMDYDVVSFDLDAFTNKIHNDYLVHDSPSVAANRKRRETDTGEVDTYTSITSEDKVQMVLTDKQSGSGSGQLAIKTAKMIMHDMQNDPASFSILTVSMESSEAGTSGQTSLSGGAVAGIVIGVIVLIAVVVTGAFLFRRKRSHFFYKDAPLNADMDTPGGAFPENMPANPAVFVQSFENPVYAATQDSLYSHPLDSFARKKETGLPPPEELGFTNASYEVMMDVEDKAGPTDLSKMESDS